MHLHAGGFWHKWNSEMFNPKVLTAVNSLLSNFYFKIFLEDSSDTPEKLNMDTMAFAFGLLIIGLLTGFLLFLFEFSCKKQDACLE